MPLRSNCLASSPLSGRGRGGCAPGVPAGTRSPWSEMKLPAALGAGIGISQASTEPAVWASAGRIVTTVEAAAAPSTRTDLRLGLKPPCSPALSSTSLISPHLCAASFIRVKAWNFERSEEAARPAAGFALHALLPPVPSPARGEGRLEKRPTDQRKDFVSAAF